MVSAPMTVRPSELFPDVRESVLEGLNARNTAWAFWAASSITISEGTVFVIFSSIEDGMISKEMPVFLRSSSLRGEAEAKIYLIVNIVLSCIWRLVY